MNVIKAQYKICTLPTKELSVLLQIAVTAIVKAMVGFPNSAIPNGQDSALQFANCMMFDINALSYLNIIN